MIWVLAAINGVLAWTICDLLNKNHDLRTQVIGLTFKLYRGCSCEVSIKEKGE